MARRPRTLGPRGSAGRGFTLIELLVAIGLFSVIAVIVAGVIASIIDTNKKAQTATSVVNNLNYTLEAMTRTLKTGSDTSVSHYDNSIACDNAIEVVNTEGVRSVYRYNSEGNGSIDHYRDLDADGSYEFAEGGPITAPEIQVASLCFYLLSGQPAVLFAVDGAMGPEDSSTRTEFRVQTTVAQRALQID